MASSRLERETVSPRVYRIAERFLSIQTTDEWAARVVDSFIGGFYFTLSSNETAIIDCDIQIRTDDPPRVPSGLQNFAVPHGLCYTDGENYSLAVDDSYVAVDALAKRISVWLGSTPHARHPTALVNTLAYMLQAALRRCALYDLHAAGVVEPSTGVGVLLPGMANSGKSSLTIRLAKSGWRYMSDDMLVLNELKGGVEARGLRRLFSVSERSLAGMSLPRIEEALGTSVASDPTKRRLDPALVFAAGRAEPCMPKVICFPSIVTEKESRIEAIGHMEAMARLIKLCPWSSYDVAAARGNLRALGRLVSQTKSFVLRAGQDMLDDPERAARLFTAQFCAESL